ncbi:TetR/AcrR family transcriptional regulator [Arthrobacter koreensis]|uniref:TetR/AcrR family transcriptional regulator n=1 Tax=Arthrobacter koreensis TaxID=199136 RepID=UPI002DBBCAA0|nr:TetR/AcrR family transcriptional regulator C-terminal domain-containing protein [Arthrobacter koreensis]MEB7504908.1 TetR/AcrR family transcriptional regulator C-terminal domain-containing protein [Arthrobacter koreensis]
MGAHQPLGPAAIARAGARIADAEGLDAVSMRRVAGELGVSAMALYRHVADRRSLLLLMAEAVRNYPLVPAGNHTWQDMLAHMADVQWRTFTAHPWLLSIILTPRRLVNMAAPAEAERLLSALAAAGLASDEAFDCLLGVSAAVIGTAAIAAAAEDGPGISPQEPGDGAEPASLAERFQQRGISYRTSRQSLDYLVDSFIRGVESRLHNSPDPSPDPVPRKENHAVEG